jgi:hypothetical protein
LLDKLYHYGIRGVALKWIRSYLDHQYQYVYLNGHISSKLEIITGVPQGSILVPLLFIIYINDIINASHKLKFFLYADDTNILFSEKSNHQLKENIEYELKKLCDWFTLNKLTLNLSKTAYIVFGEDEIDLKIKMNKTQLLQLPLVKFLGIFIDNKLKWNKHIEYLENKLIKHIRILNIIKNKLDKKSLLKVYNSLFCLIYHIVVKYGEMPIKLYFKKLEYYKRNLLE